ncbi:MAG: glycoside hydrolase family 3 C-terminal domain-containing protein [Hyphomicrobiales bacterium]|nr:glycoside hydrolase family 3 C-terminal domain-containing protein [Hyphomicrobiales bacterium]
MRLPSLPALLLASATALGLLAATARAQTSPADPFAPKPERAIVAAGPIHDRSGLSPREVEARIDALLARMTLDDKIGQMFAGGWAPDFDDREVREGRVGILSGVETAAEMARLQRLARASRLGIPLIFTRDSLHGYRTLAPVPLGLAASFDPEIIASAGRMTGREASSQGMHLTFSPMVDLTRDPRWGRVVEGAGEDPFLARLFARSMVTGLGEGGLQATLKHFVGYGAVRAGRDYAEAEISVPTLHDLHLPPFRAGFEAGAQVVMAAFSVLNGKPVTADRRLLTGLLRERWGFDGIVISDWDAIRELIPHGVAASREEAAEKAVTAGIDVDLASGLYREQLPGLVASGRASMARIDEAVRRVLRVKFRFGLFDPQATPEVDPAVAARSWATPELRAVALEAARRSIVLLKNDGDLLPLDHPPKRIAVIGAAARDAGDLMGSWGAKAEREDTPLFLDELRARLKPFGTTVDFAEGCDDACLKSDGFEAAAKVAAKADLVVAVLGEPWYLTAESTSRTRLGLPNRQQALLDRLHRSGRPIVLVTLAGRPMAMGEALAKAKAVVYAFSPGTMGGRALVDVLVGATNPSARLPMSLPRAVGQLPFSYDMLPTGRPPKPDDDLSARYVDEAVTPLLPFGFGLSYTRFAYSDLAVVHPRIGAGETQRIEVTVRNVGARAGREIVQLYVHDPVASRSRPLRQLRGLARVDLEPGEAKTVTIDLPIDELAFADEDGRRVLEPGRFEVFVGGSSAATLTTSFELISP